ncbi:hypothetical protein L1987_71448 [Smallanthus sonchifolius]|uniref:Uncharacterized protein n=1 Tax=Smallanthus sonchifolius TaxID=185202 RepID=A0ACB9AS32_9ASTR|nr:hypothetical protein L1987_71448 [Smallanthus sonchifolius]
MEGRLRVEKASAEARERAVADKFSYQSTGIRQNSLPSDLAGSYSGLRYYQASSQGGEGESPQRCKARLERHQRTADRAAKALAEKNTRDLIAQKEQAERRRLAEGLDAEVKRWSSGKQGNLRALLSTLQYILGADSGWQPVPLTEVITTAAVKKAYRKATLFLIFSRKPGTNSIQKSGSRVISVLRELTVYTCFRNDLYSVHETSNPFISVSCSSSICFFVCKFQLKMCRDG